MEHTPTPWKVFDDDLTKVKNLEGVGVAVMSGGNRFTLLEQQRNAQFIVTAVNSHDELVSALSEYVAEWEAKHSEEDQRTGYTREPQSLVMARSALKSAGVSL